MLENLVDLMGWAGAGLMLIPYYLVSTGRIVANSVVFQGGNVLGSILLILNSLYYGALPSVFVNVVWISIGISALIGIYVKRRATHD